MEQRARSRRELLTTLALAGTGSLVRGAASAAAAWQDDKSKADLAVIHGGDVKAAIRAAVEAIGGITRFVSRGDVVFLKPNVGWARTPAQGANTTPR